MGEEESYEGSGDTNELYEGKGNVTVPETSEPASEFEESMGATDSSSQKQADSQSGEGSSSTTSPCPWPCPNPPQENYYSLPLVLYHLFLFLLYLLLLLRPQPQPGPLSGVPAPVHSLPTPCPHSSTFSLGPQPTQRLSASQEWLRNNTSGEASTDSQAEMDSAQPSDDASVSSTSQEPTSSSAGHSSVQPKPFGRPIAQHSLPMRTSNGGRTLIPRGGMGFPRAGRSPFGRGNLPR
nr:uncharacterized protein LOC111956970 [Salvelinus alpinus]